MKLPKTPFLDKFAFRSGPLNATAFLGSNPRLEGFGDPRSQSRNLGHPIFDG